MIAGPANSTPSFSSYAKQTGSGAYILLGLSLLSYLFFSAWTIFVPGIVIHQYQIWRLATFSVAVMQILSLVFQVIFVLFWSSGYERETGTLNFLYKIVTYSVLLALPCLVIELIAEKAFEVDLNRLLMLHSIWPLYFWQISTNCFNNPDQMTRTFFIPMSFPNRYLPFAILLINFMFNQRVTIVDFMPILFGYLESAYPEFFNRLKINGFTLTWLEARLAFLNRVGTFYKVGLGTSTMNAQLGPAQATPTQNVSTQMTATTVDPPKLVTGKVKVGGKVMTKEERRQAWIKRFGGEGQTPPDNFDEDYENSSVNDLDESEDFGLITKKDTAAK